MTLVTVIDICSFLFMRKCTIFKAKIKEAELLSKKIDIQI